MKNTILLLLAFITLTSVTAQSSLNDYKYVVIPKQFDFLNEADEFRLNSLTQFLFEKYNFETLMEGETMPSDYAKNNCLGLKADVLKNSSMFKTKLTVKLTNCLNEVVFTSIEGESRDKNYKIAYNKALRDAFKSIETANYSYNSNNAMVAGESSESEAKGQEEIEKLKEEIKVLKEAKLEVVEQESIEIEEIIEQPIVKIESIEETAPKLIETANSTDVLYAQKVSNGYQLVDKSPKVIYIIKETGMSNVYLVEGKNAIMYKLDANWILEYYNNDSLQTKIVNIKF